MNSIRKQHLYFWIGFFFVDYLQSLIYFSDIQDENGSYYLATFWASVFAVVGKIICFYFIYYLLLKPVLKGRLKLWVGIVLLFLWGFVFLLLYRALVFYYVYPEILGINTSERTYLNPGAIFFTYFDILTPTFLLLIFEFYVYTRNAKEREAVLQREKLQSELNFLKAQVNPHFIFNMLSTIHALSRNECKEAARVSIKLADMMRFMMGSADNKSIALSEEIKILDDYVDLESIRYKNKLDIDFVKEVPDMTKRIAPLILLPFVENAFKHGAAESRFNSSIYIKLTVEEDLLWFTVKNSVESSSTQVSIDNLGIGLKNVRRQLELLYPSNKLYIEHQENIFFISLKIKLSENE